MIKFHVIKQRFLFYKSCFILEFNRTKELFSLVKKSFYKKLNSEEQQKVKSQTKSLLKLIPAFLIFMLPAGTLWLFLFFKLIPSMLPSSFRTNTKNKDI
ncbi:LETM1 domain-containing protein [Tenacibaculum agarivorans]|uniref:LETM1 domain-containing protein n=1 Tax=Tenacibaculum agarivorans TaxID=1908389 RepID=UPI00094B97EF